MAALDTPPPLLGVKSDPQTWALERWTLRYTQRQGQPFRELERMFQERQALRYAWPVRIVTVVFFCVSLTLVYYDWLRFLSGQDQLAAQPGSGTFGQAGCSANNSGNSSGPCGPQNVAAFDAALAIRLGGMLPLSIAIVAYTFTRRYLASAQPIGLGIWILGNCIIAYVIVGNNPGYGLLAMLIVYIYSFTPIHVYLSTLICGTLVATYGVVLGLTQSQWAHVSTLDTGVAQPNFEEMLLNILGVLAVFTAIVGFIGHNLEYWLRQSFLDEVRLSAEKAALQDEMKLSEALLVTMVPPSILSQLQAGRTMIADSVPAVTVLFCELRLDVYRYPPHVVISVLNMVYSGFDSLIDAYGMHKIETVGEVYLAVAGCPEPAEDHAAKAAEMALAMRAALPLIRREVERETGVPGSDIDIRIGLNSGPVAAGVVGIKNPRYKLIGDTVNTASRMESTALHGTIQISEFTKECLEEIAPGHFVVLPRGCIPVKGKGNMNTFWLVGSSDIPTTPSVLEAINQEARDSAQQGEPALGGLSCTTDTAPDSQHGSGHRSKHSDFEGTARCSDAAVEYGSPMGSLPPPAVQALGSQHRIAATARGSSSTPPLGNAVPVAYRLQGGVGGLPSGCPPLLGGSNGAMSVGSSGAGTAASLSPPPSLLQRDGQPEAAGIAEAGVSPTTAGSSFPSPRPWHHVCGSAPSKDGFGSDRALVASGLLVRSPSRMAMAQSRHSLLGLGEEEGGFATRRTARGGVTPVTQRGVLQSPGQATNAVASLDSGGSIDSLSRKNITTFVAPSARGAASMSLYTLPESRTRAERRHELQLVGLALVGSAVREDRHDDEDDDDGSNPSNAAALTLSSLIAMGAQGGESLTLRALRHGAGGGPSTAVAVHRRPSKLQLKPLHSDRQRSSMLQRDVSGLVDIGGDVLAAAAPSRYYRFGRLSTIASGSTASAAVTPVQAATSPALDASPNLKYAHGGNSRLPGDGDRGAPAARVPHRAGLPFQPLSAAAVGRGWSPGNFLRSTAAAASAATSALLVTMTERLPTKLKPAGPHPGRLQTAVPLPLRRGSSGISERAGRVADLSRLTSRRSSAGDTVLAIVKERLGKSTSHLLSPVSAPEPSVSGHGLCIEVYDSGSGGSLHRASWQQRAESSVRNAIAGALPRHLGDRVLDERALAPSTKHVRPQSAPDDGKQPVSLLRGQRLGSHNGDLPHRRQRFPGGPTESRDEREFFAYFDAVNSEPPVEVRSRSGSGSQASSETGGSAVDAAGASAANEPVSTPHRQSAMLWVAGALLSASGGGGNGGLAREHVSVPSTADAGGRARSAHILPLVGTGPTAAAAAVRHRGDQTANASSRTLLLDRLRGVSRSGSGGGGLVMDPATERGISRVTSVLGVESDAPMSRAHFHPSPRAQRTIVDNALPTLPQTAAPQKRQASRASTDAQSWASSPNDTLADPHCHAANRSSTSVPDAASGHVALSIGSPRPGIAGWNSQTAPCSGLCNGGATLAVFLCGASDYNDDGASRLCATAGASIPAAAGSHATAHSGVVEGGEQLLIGSYRSHMLEQPGCGSLPGFALESAFAGQLRLSPTVHARDASPTTQVTGLVLSPVEGYSHVATTSSAAVLSPMDFPPAVFPPQGIPGIPNSQDLHCSAAAELPSSVTSIEKAGATGSLVPFSPVVVPPTPVSGTSEASLALPPERRRTETLFDALVHPAADLGTRFVCEDDGTEFGEDDNEVRDRLSAPGTGDTQALREDHFPVDKGAVGGKKGAGVAFFGGKAGGVRGGAAAARHRRASISEELARRGGVRWTDRIGLCLNRPMLRGFAGSLERSFQTEARVSWHRFVRSSAALGIVMLVLFLIPDAMKYQSSGSSASLGGADVGLIWRTIAVVRYAVMVPMLLLFLLLSSTQAYRRSWAFNQAVTLTTVVGLGIGIIAISVVGRDPGYGILALYVVYCLNFSVLALLFRLVALSVLILLYTAATIWFNSDIITPHDAAIYLLYLAVFSFGEAIPVIMRENTVRQNFFRRIAIGIERKKLMEERRHTDNLLENLLPAVIVPRLRASQSGGGGLIADSFEEVTILWTDLKGFTAFSSTRPPMEVVVFLNAMFSTFDRILDKYGIRKVEVLGDAFFVVGGCPVQIEDHAERCANAALEMLAHIPIMRRFVGGADIDMRVGLHTGPVVAGVVGSKDPRYHLFGATVPIANSMESQGVPGRIHISATTYAKLRSRQLVRAERFKDKMAQIYGETPNVSTSSSCRVGTSCAAEAPAAAGATTTLESRAAVSPTAAAVAGAAGSAAVGAAAAAADGCSIGRYTRIDLDELDAWSRSMTGYRPDVVPLPTSAVDLGKMAAYATAAAHVQLDAPRAIATSSEAFVDALMALDARRVATEDSDPSVHGDADTDGTLSGLGNSNSDYYTRSKTEATTRMGDAAFLASRKAANVAFNDAASIALSGTMTALRRTSDRRPSSSHGSSYFGRLRFVPENGPGSVRGLMQVWQGNSVFLGWQVVVNSRQGALVYRNFPSEGLPRLPSVLTGTCSGFFAASVHEETEPSTGQETTRLQTEVNVSTVSTLLSPDLIASASATLLTGMQTGSFSGVPGAVQHTDTTVVASRAEAQHNWHSRCHDPAVGREAARSSCSQNDETKSKGAAAGSGGTARRGCAAEGGATGVGHAAPFHATGGVGAAAGVDEAAAAFSHGITRVQQRHAAAAAATSRKQRHASMAVSGIKGAKEWATRVRRQSLQTMFVRGGTVEGGTSGVGRGSPQRKTQKLPPSDAVHGLFHATDEDEFFGPSGGFFSFEARAEVVAPGLRTATGDPTATYFLERADPPFVPVLETKLAQLQQKLLLWCEIVNGSGFGTGSGQAM